MLVVTPFKLERSGTRSEGSPVPRHCRRIQIASLPTSQGYVHLPPPRESSGYNACQSPADRWGPYTDTYLRTWDRQAELVLTAGLQHEKDEIVTPRSRRPLLMGKKYSSSSYAIDSIAACVASTAPPVRLRVTSRKSVYLALSAQSTAQNVRLLAVPPHLGDERPEGHSRLREGEEICIERRLGPDGLASAIRADWSFVDAPRQAIVVEARLPEMVLE